jgi:ketosteroid isomerase-like protein
MRRRLLNHARVAVLIPLFATSCAETVKAPPPPPVQWASLRPRVSVAEAPRVTATEKERLTASLYLKALASPAMSKLGPALDDEAHFRFAGAKDVRGRENVVKAHEALFGRFAERSIMANRVLLTESSQSLEWTMTGRHIATQKPVIIKGLTLLWTKDDGSITDIHLYFDEAMVQAQLGLGPESLRGVHPALPASNAVQLVEQQRSADEQANVAIVRAELQALEDNNEAAYLATFGDDLEVSLPESAQPLRGKAPARSYFKTMRNAIGYLATSIENIWGVGPFVAVEYQLLGEQRAPLGWVPLQKDKLIKMSLVDVVEIRDGKIARVWRYDNPIQIVSSP